MLNELWQMDFGGPRGWRHPVGQLSVIDDHSRYLIALSAKPAARTPPQCKQALPESHGEPSNHDSLRTKKVDQSCQCH
jgi:hypothetical protein